MHFSQLFVPFAIASMVAAIPTQTLVTRKLTVVGLPTKSVICGAGHARAQTFTADQIRTAAELALELVNNGKQLGTLLSACINL